MRRHEPELQPVEGTEHTESSEPSTAQERRETGRVEALSDGVFGIAMTLLVLSIPIPKSLPSHETLQHQALGGLAWIPLLTYVISFLTILVMWLNHHYLFQFVARIDRFFVIANGLLLMLVVFVNYPTALVATFFADPPSRVFAAVVYNVTLILIALCYQAMWFRVIMGRRLVATGADHAEIALLSRQYLTGGSLYVVALALAFYSPVISIALDAALAVYFAFTGKIIRRDAGAPTMSQPGQISTDSAFPIRIALISDIHGDLVALDAVLADIAARGVERIVCLGDTALSGPQPHECVARIRALGCPTVMGNCDELVLRLRREGLSEGTLTGYRRFGAWVAEIDLWSAQTLTEDDCAWLAALPLTVSAPLGPGASLLCSHGSPQSFNHRLLPDPAAQPDERLAELVGPVEASDVVALACGHTHLPMRRDLGALAIVNPGSVGLPMAASDGLIVNPWDYAEYGLLTWEADGADAAGALRWEPRRVAVDKDLSRAAALASGMPHADRWRGDWTRP